MGGPSKAPRRPRARSARDGEDVRPVLDGDRLPRGVPCCRSTVPHLRERFHPKRNREPTRGCLRQGSALCSGTAGRYLLWEHACCRLGARHRAHCSARTGSESAVSGTTRSTIPCRRVFGLGTCSNARGGTSRVGRRWLHRSFVRPRLHRRSFAVGAQPGPDGTGGHSSCRAGTCGRRRQAATTRARHPRTGNRRPSTWRFTL